MQNANPNASPSNSDYKESIMETTLILGLYRDSINGKESGNYCSIWFRWTPHPVIVTIMDNEDCIRVLLYSHYTTITGWGVHLMHRIGLHYERIIARKLVMLPLMDCTKTCGACSRASATMNVPKKS